LLVQTLYPFNLLQINGTLTDVNSLLNNLISLQISLIKFIIIVLIFIFILSLVTLFFKENKGIKVYPFKVYSDQKEYNGKIISERLIFESQRIWNIYQNAKQVFTDDFFKTVPSLDEKFSSVEQSGKRNISVLDKSLSGKNCDHLNSYNSQINNRNEYSGRDVETFPYVPLSTFWTGYKSGFESQRAGVLASESILPFKMNFFSEDIESLFSNLGDINFAGVTLHLGGLILVLRQLLTPYNSSQYITGSLHDNDYEIHLIAMIEGRNRYTWELSEKKNKLRNDGWTLHLAKDLTFKIIHDLSLGKNNNKEWPKTKTWEGFEHFTEAIDSYILYTNTGRLGHIEKSRRNCIRCLEYEKDYLPLFKLFYILGIEYYLIKDYYFSEDTLRQCIGHMPQEEIVYSALSDTLHKLGRDEEALEAAEKVTKIKPDFSTSWVNKSLALVNLDRYEEALKAGKKAIELKEMELKEVEELNKKQN
jgi:tetratricopeptide (TPR) repeat protein